MFHLRARLYKQLDPLAWPGAGISPANRVVLWIVLLSILAAVLGSEPKLRVLSPATFSALNAFFAICFAIEYAIRLWSAGENPRYAGLAGRFRYACTYVSLIDLIATLALWADLLFGVTGVYGVLLRLVRVLRVITLTQNSRWSMAVRLLTRAIRERQLELALSFGLAAVILFLAATALFVVEGETQPEAFGSIPRAMWWAMITLTTVGYGDVYPVTGLGKLFAGLAALTSIAIVAMPTGIMAAAFSDMFQRFREKNDQRPPGPPSA